MNKNYKHNRKRLGEWGGFVLPHSEKKLKDYKSEDTYIYSIYRANQEAISKEWKSYQGFKTHVKETIKREGYRNAEDALYAISRTTRFTSKEERGLQNIEKNMSNDLRTKINDYGIYDLSEFHWVKTGNDPDDNSGRYESNRQVRTANGLQIMVLEFKNKYDSQTEDMVNMYFI